MSGVGYRATQHLIILGHRRICFAHSFIGTLLTTSVRERFEGYRKALSEYGVAFDESLVFPFPRWPKDEANNPCDEFLARHDGPTAILTSTDGIAIELIHSAHRIGRRVPEELAIVGVDNLSSSSATHPPLTTIAQPARQIGVSAANLLINRIEGQAGPPQHIELPTSLIVRKSCGARLHVQKSVQAP
jgi:DNA-binding LacI/PurR family transcriptional regulator